MRYAVVLIVALSVLAGCRAEDTNAMAKLDAPLRQKLEELRESNRREVIPVLGKCGGQIDEDTKRAIAHQGATLLSADGDSFTARVPSEHLMDLARLASVTQLQLAQTAQPTTP
ncbi:MAG TPA: hypothetical protein VJY35_10170 [Candidatus Eisenbacteria bacterium]|nr:hypothetical protein [Candidatus Eisenbacteria bacterium]